MISIGEHYYSLHSDIPGRKKILSQVKLIFFFLNTYPRCQPVTVLQATTTPVNLSIAQSLLSITIHI